MTTIVETIFQCSLATGGRAVGASFSKRIKRAFVLDVVLQRLVKKVRETAHGKAIFDELKSHAKQRYPLYIAEVNGTASGAGVDFDTVLIANFRQELGTSEPADEGLWSPDACTDLLLRDTSHGVAGWAHNEDYATLFFDSVYFVQQIHVSTDGEELFSFSSFAYPGVLPGWAPGWNSYGIGMSWNVLFPSQMRPGPSVAVAFVCRDALTARSIEEAVHLATPEDLALGQNLNVGSFHTKQIVTVETAPGGAKNALNIVDGAPVTFHANEYLRMKDVPQIISPLTSSRHRKLAFEQLEKKGLHSMNDLLLVLGDTSDAAYPIFRRNDTTHEDTLFTVAFDLIGQSISAYRANPKLGKDAMQWTVHVNMSSPMLPPVILV